MSCCRVVIISLSLFAIVPTYADDEHRHPHHQAIEEIVVTADPLSGVDGHFAAPVTVLDQAALRRESTRSIGETVSNQLGVNSSDFGASVGRPIIRGLGGGRVRVLEDGIGTMDLSTISADHGVAVESIFAEQVEILRGPATLLYGSGASGGLVNVVNGRILSSVPEGIEAGAYGHYDTASDAWLGAIKLNAGIGDMFAVHFDGLKRDTENIDIPGFAEVMPDPGERPGTLPNSDSESHNYSGGGSFVGTRGFIGFNVARLENEYGVPGAHHEEGEEGGEEEAEEEGGTRIDLRQTRYDVKGAYDFSGGWFQQFKGRFAVNDYQHDEIEGSGVIGTQFENQEYEGRAELIHRPIGRWDGVIGLQFRDQDFSAVGEEAFVPPSELDSIAVFIFEKADFDKIHLDLGIRGEFQDAESDASIDDAAHNLLSLSAGATYEYTAGFELGISGTRSQRAPTIEELFSGGPHLASTTFEIGNVNLGEETSHNVDIFWRKVDGRYRFDFTLFYNDIADFIFLQSNDRNGDGVADRVEEDFLETGEIIDEEEALLLVNQTQTDAEFFGFELETRVTLFDDSRGSVELRVWTDYVEGDLKIGGSVPRLPPLRYGGGLEWERGPVYAGVSAVRTTDQDDLGALETETDGYTMVNVHAGYTVPLGNDRSLTFFARGTNLADEEARRHTSLVKDLAPLPGISGLIGIRAKY
ncbi:MAG: TonB-dependent receptor [Proteobacteria bacterium]|nr:TonB-dependent receptor [Pseudomonadota bacterium]